MWLKIFGPKKQNQQVKKKSVHDSLLTRIENIDAQNGMKVFSPDKSIVLMRAPYKTITEYVRFLFRVRSVVLDEKKVQSILFQNSPETFFVSEWFVNETKKYLDAVKELANFKEEARAFVELFIKLEIEDSEKNQALMNMLSPTITQLKEITEILVNVTGEKKPDITSDQDDIFKPVY